MKRFALLSTIPLILTGCGGSSAPAPPTGKTALLFSVAGNFTNLSSAKAIQVTAKLPAGVFPIFSSNSNQIVKTGVNALQGIGAATVLPAASFSATTREIIFNAIATDYTNGSITGDFAKLTYTTTGSPTFGNMTTTYKVVYFGGVDLTHRVTQKTVTPTTY